MNSKKYPRSPLGYFFSLALICGALSVNAQEPPANPERRQAADKAVRKNRYSLEQAISDKAQLNTIAFDALAFLTGDFALDTFLPPGKVSDYFGFQYMRDIDTVEGGHNSSFLTRIAFNMLSILSPAQRKELVDLAQAQDRDIQRLAEMRIPLIQAFRWNLSKEFPKGTNALDLVAVQQRSSELYQLDGVLAFERAKVMAKIYRELSDSQRLALRRLSFGDSRTWPDTEEVIDRQSIPHSVHVSVMTYASEMFSWVAGSIDADTYFCPERHGMYFGGFGMKTAPAMGKENYSISTALTGDSGQAMLSVLNETQRGLITDLLTTQRQSLMEIPRVRRDIAVELRRFLDGGVADREKVVALSRRYGELDGHLSFLYATAFAKVGWTLSPQQVVQLRRLRIIDPKDPKGPFLYSDPVRVVNAQGADQFFGVSR